MRAIAEGSPNLGRRVADDDSDTRDPFAHEVLHYDTKDSLVGNRDELLGHCVRDQPHSGVQIADEDESLQHRGFYR